MGVEAKLVLALIVLIVSYLPIWRRLLPYNLVVTHDVITGWHARIERRE